ncbi:MAG: hypothetical protein COT18_07370 [Elusimicrobia bacterium CG08_land_8_20_14_0_20_59_10]|nr:MAG: hypothetical protein COT18_07370 [Elusimicrobia bacterium CG08_land_8_20_14_0_20_59_10]
MRSNKPLKSRFHLGPSTLPQPAARPYNHCMGKSVLKAAVAALFLSAGPAHAEENEVIFNELPYPVEMRLPGSQKAGAVLFESRYSETAEADYDTVLLQGEMPDPAIRLDVVVRANFFFPADRRYKPERSRRFPGGRFWARYRLDALTRQPLKFSVVNLDLKEDSTLTIYETELLRSDSMSETEEVLPSTFTYVPDPALSLPENIPFRLVRRAGWSAAAPTGPFTPHQPFYFTLHHTQAHYPGTYDRALAEMQFIQDFHQNGRGWIDIGYHFLIDPFGNIFEGRPISVVGAHVKYHNTGNIGISIMGSFHPPVSNIFTPGAKGSFLAVGTYLKDTYTVNRSSFYAHRDLGPTACPGDGLYAVMGTLRGLIFDPQPVPVPPAPELQPNAAQSKSLRQLINFYK